MYIDLSKYNVVTDWSQVAKAVEGVFLRVAYRGYGSGKIVLDSMFETYAKACYNYRIPFGLYFMSQAINPVEAIEEADFALNYAEKYNASLPIFIDSEDGDGTARIVRADALNKSDRTDVCEFFCKTVAGCRYKTGVYASTSWFENRLDVNRLNEFLFWVAQYAPECKAKHRIDMWQYTSKGSIPGINGNVDCNILYGFPNTNYTSVSRILKIGSSGQDVKDLQSKLNLKYNTGLTIDGVFGINTYDAVLKVQNLNGIKADGIVGESTKKYL